MSNLELDSMTEILLNTDNPLSQQSLKKQLHEIQSKQVLQEEQLEVDML